MTAEQTIECALLKRAVETTDPNGDKLQLESFVQELQKDFPDSNIRHDDVVDAMKRLWNRKCLRLRKWDAPNMVLRDYKGGNDDALFFLRQPTWEFRVQRTEESKPYLEQFQVPHDLPKRPIGFGGKVEVSRVPNTVVVGKKCRNPDCGHEASEHENLIGSCSACDCPEFK